MMALRARELPVGNWLYEMKFDGYRALAFKAGSEVRLLSRNRTLFNDNYPRLVDSIKVLKAKSFALDAARRFCAQLFPTKYGNAADALDAKASERPDLIDGWHFTVVKSDEGVV